MSRFHHVLRTPLLAALSLASLGFLSAAPAARADLSETVLHTFPTGANDGQNPPGNLVQATDGNFYGVTQSGGTANEGIAFKISTSGTLTVLHNFADGSVMNDGQDPLGGLTIGSDSNFYGATVGGGAHNLGTVFKMTSTGAVTILHSFSGGTDGQFPQGGVTFNTDGKLYATTNNSDSGGTAEYGTVCSMNSDGSGYVVQFRFNSGNSNAYGLEPVGRLAEVPGSSNKQLYGTNLGGGANNDGTLFKITPGTTDGSAAVALVHAFGDSSVMNDGQTPSNDGFLATDSSGTIYGDTLYGGSEGDGTVFKITPSGSVTILHSFGSATNDGENPSGGLTRASDNDFYGATQFGGTSGDGTVYKISSGGSVYSVVRNFDSGSTAGAQPVARPAEDSDGNLVGTTMRGGVVKDSSGDGVIYKLTASLPNPVKITKLALSPTSVVGGSANATGTVTLAEPAPSAGAKVTLTSSNTSAATVPSSITIPANHIHGTFTVTSHSVSSTTTAMITASYNSSSATANLTVTPAASVGLQSVTLAASSAYGGSVLTGNRIQLTGMASADTKVTLSSSDTSVATVPSSETIQSGSSSHSFTVTTYNVTSAKSVTISATLNGVTKTATLTVKPGLSQITLGASSVKGGTSLSGNRISLTGAADGDTQVTLGSSNAGVAAPPSTETIQSGSSSHSFTITTHTVSSNTTVTITATLGGVTKTATLTVTP